MTPPPTSRSRSKSQSKLSGTGVTSRRLVLITILLSGLFYYFTSSSKKKYLLGEGVDSRTPSSFLRSSTEDVASKKIDYVVTFVSLDRGMNGTMVEKLSRTRKGTTSDGFSRESYTPGEMKNYRDFGELFWSLYSLFRYGGLCDQDFSESIMTLTRETRERSCLIGRVFVVVTSVDEVPEWLRSIVTSPTLPLRSTQFEEFLWTKVRVTLHKTLIKRFLFDASTAGKRKPGHIRSISTALKKKFDGLKLYNSNLIEALIPYIPTLSQFFIYLNNDMILTKETRISDWFHKVLVTDGKIMMGDSSVVPKVFYEHVPAAGSKEAGENQHCVGKDFHCYTYEKIKRVVLGEGGYREVVKNSFKGGAAILPHTPRLFSKLRYQNLIVPFKEHLLQLFIKYSEASQRSGTGIQVPLGRNPEEDPWLQLMYIYQEAVPEGNLFPSSAPTIKRSKKSEEAIDLTRQPNNNKGKVRSRLERVQSFVPSELILKHKDKEEGDDNEKRHVDASFLQEDGRFLFFQVDSLQFMKELAFSDPLVLGANRNRLLSICLNDDLPDLVQPAPISRKRSRVEITTKAKPSGVDVLSMCEPYLHVYSAGIDHLVAEDVVASGQERTVSDIQLLKRIRLAPAPDQMDLLDPLRGDTLFRSTAALYQLFFCRLFLE